MCAVIENKVKGKQKMEECPYSCGEYIKGVTQTEIRVFSGKIREPCCFPLCKIPVLIYGKTLAAAAQ